MEGRREKLCAPTSEDQNISNGYKASQFQVFESTQWFLAVTELKTNPVQGKQRIKAIADDEASPYWEEAQRTVRRYRLK